MKNFKILLGTLAFQLVCYAQTKVISFEKKESGITRQYKESSSAFGEVDGKKAIVFSGIDATDTKRTDIWILDDTSGKFILKQELEGVSNGNVYLVDFDKDSDMDILVSGVDGSNSSKIIYYLNDKGNFTKKQEISGMRNVNDFAVGDYDNDGYQDFIIAGGVRFNTKAILYKFNGVKFLDSKIKVPQLREGGLKFADFNGDGLLDFIISGRDNKMNKHYIEVCIQNKNGTFDESQILHNSLIDSKISVGDIDNDGDVDFAICGRVFATENAPIQVFINDANAHFTLKYTLESDFYSVKGRNTLQFADFDKDNDLDLVAVGRKMDDTKHFVLFNNHNGFTKNYEFSEAIGDNGTISIADINNDTYLDMIITGENAKNTLSTELFVLDKSKLASREVSSQHEIKIFPNPVSSSFSVVGGTKVNYLEILDFSGKRIKYFTENKLFDISDLPKGIYIVVINNKEKIKILKQ